MDSVLVEPLQLRGFSKMTWLKIGYFVGLILLMIAAGMFDFEHLSIAVLGVGLRTVCWVLIAVGTAIVLLARLKKSFKF